jgi:uncharacterized membrane protein YkvI
MTGNWFLSALLYVFYNCICAVTALPPLGLKVKSTRSAILGGALGGLGIAILAGVIYVAVMSNAAAAIQSPMPMLGVAQSISPVAGGFYMFVLFAAIYSTAAGIMFAIRGRLENVKVLKDSPKKINLLLVGFAILGIVGTRIGFVTLISVIYPLLGYVGMGILALLIINFIVSKSRGDLGAEKKSV